MTQPLIVTQLLLKRAEIDAQIRSLEDRLGQARADLLHVAATVRLLDPTAIDRPATVYHGATKALGRSDLFALCRAALEASLEPLCTCQLARHVITAEGWDSDDNRLKLAIAHKVGAMMKRMTQCGAVRKVGLRPLLPLPYVDKRENYRRWRSTRNVRSCPRRLRSRQPVKPTR